MNKQTKILLGVGAIGVVLYILMKPKKPKDTTQYRTLPPDSDPDYTPPQDNVVSNLDKETCEKYGGTFKYNRGGIISGICINPTKILTQ